MIIDTHIHLDNERYTEDVDKVIIDAMAEGVGRFIIPGADPKDLPRAKMLSEKYEEVYYAVGMHPYDMDNYSEALIRENIVNKKCIAIGECGLDYFRLPEDKTAREAEVKEQKKVFREHIRLANEFDVPLIVHIRDASHDARVILEEECSKGGVLHCFNADEELLPLADMNFYFGIGGVLTFKNARKLVNVLPKIPKDKLLIETDGPYLTPHPHRGERNEPKYTALVADKISDLLEMSLEEVNMLTTTNAHKLFSIDI